MENSENSSFGLADNVKFVNVNKESKIMNVDTTSGEMDMAQYTTVLAKMLKLEIIRITTLHFFLSDKLNLIPIIIWAIVHVDELRCVRHLTVCL